MADLSKIKLNGTEYDLKDAVARNLLHIINIELTGDTYNNFPIGQLNCSQEELKNYYENGLCILRYREDENNYQYSQILYYDSAYSQTLSGNMGETLDIYYINGSITVGLDAELIADSSMIAVKSDGTCFILTSQHKIPYVTDNSSKGIYDTVTGQLDISNIVINSDLATVATSGNYNDLTNKPTIPEDKLFLVNVTMNSMTSGTSDKSSAEIASAVNAGKLPIVKTGMGQMSMMATLVNIEETQENGETYYFATFMYNDENNGHTSSPTFATKAVMIIIGTNVILQIKTGSYITNYELEEKGYLTSYTETDPTVPAWAKAATKPIYTAAEVGALPDTTIIPAAQVNADWDATSGVAQILHKPTIPNVPTWALAASKPTYSFSELTSHPTTINDYGITDAYTKTEINGLVSGVLHYKGTKATTSALPSNDNVIGDVWHITADGSEWAWDGSNWQELGTAVDLSAYRTATAQDAIDQAQNTAIAAKYIKPSGGIPKTDLATDIQTSLGKADTALQEHQSLAAYRTAAAQDLIDQNQNTAIGAKYTKPTNGIPASDLTSAVQTSLGKADTALQSYTETDPIFTASAAANISSTDISNWNAKSDFSGSYNDLTNKPTIPAAQVQSDWNATSGMGVILNKPNLSTFMVKGTDYVTAGKKTGTTLGNKATAEGYNTTASENNSHAEGEYTTASGGSSHAEGEYTTASGNYSHAEGNRTTASGGSSHAEGGYTTASGTSSHAEGYYTTASGNSSHAEGQYTTAQSRSQHVFGEYNILDTTGTTTTKGQYVEIVGNGTSSARSNARTLDWSGNEVLAGKLTIGTAPTADMDVTTKQYVDSAITTAIGGINQFEVAIVTNLPTANIDTHTIYFKSNLSSGNNVYDEYIYINNNWELIGSTQVDLSNYLQTSDIAAWAKAANKPTYTAAEVGALPDTTVIPAAQVNSDWNATNGVAQILHKPSIPEAETDANVENMLDSFNLDYTSNTTNSNYANGVNF